MDEEDFVSHENMNNQSTNDITFNNNENDSTSIESNLSIDDDLSVGNDSIINNNQSADDNQFIDNNQSIDNNPADVETTSSADSSLNVDNLISVDNSLNGNITATPENTGFQYSPAPGDANVASVSNTSSFHENINKDDNNSFIIAYSVLFIALAVFLIGAIFFVSKKRLYEKEKEEYIKEKAGDNVINTYRSITLPSYHDSMSQSNTNSFNNSKSYSNRHSISNSSYHSKRSNTNNKSSISLSIFDNETDSYPQIGIYSSNIEKASNEMMPSYNLTRYPQTLKYSEMLQNKNKNQRKNQNLSLKTDYSPEKNEQKSNSNKSNNPDISLSPTALKPKLVVTTNVNISKNAILPIKEDYYEYN